MCELLIKAQSATHSDLTKSERGCYKIGDIVDVREDGFKWGKSECPPKFYIVKLTNVSVKDAQKYIVADYDTTDPEHPVLLHRRLYQIPIVDIPAQIKSTLQATGSVSVTWTQIKTYVVNKTTGIGEK